MKRQFVNLDADTSAFFSSAVDAVKAKVYDRQFPELRARSLIPVSYETNTGALTTSYEYWDIYGHAKIVANYATDIPRVDLRGKKATAQIRSLAAGFGYSIQDIRTARMMGTPLEQRKANAAKQAILTLEDDIAISGDADHGLVGLLSHPNVPDVAIPADGTGSSALWSAKTADLIMRDINLLVAQIVTTTNGVESPDTLLLPLTAHNRISTLRVGESGQTVLQFLLGTSPYIKNVEIWPKLAGKGAGGTDVMIAYRRDPDKLQLEVPQDFEQMPAQEIGLTYEVNCHARTGGVIIYAPLSIAKADGI